MVSFLGTATMRESIGAGAMLIENLWNLLIPLVLIDTKPVLYTYFRKT
jgi:hypothetical protein